MRDRIYPSLADRLPTDTIQGPRDIEPRYLGDWVYRNDCAQPAEHGIGLLKKDFLGLSRTPGEIALMRGLKQTLDPRNILNRGKVFG